MGKISAALAVYNEEKNLRKCLESLKDFVDEIVVVDGESTDSTIEIAKSFGANIISKPNNKNFHINKQIAIDACKYDWVLQMDADEVVSEGLKKEIQEKVNTVQRPTTNDHINGFWIPRKNWFLGRFLMKGGQYPDYTLRFYRNGKGRLPQKDVHEQAVVEGEVRYLKEALLHYPYKNFNAYLHKWLRYNIFASDLLSKELKNASALKHIKCFLQNMLFSPCWWFVWTYGRHKGFIDMWPGFVFSLFSSLRFPVSYMIYLRSKL